MENSLNMTLRTAAKNGGRFPLAEIFRLLLALGDIGGRWTMAVAN